MTSMEFITLSVAILALVVSIISCCESDKK